LYKNKHFIIGAKSSAKKKRGKSFVLKIGKKSSKPKKSAPIPAPDENGEYEVEAIVDHKKQKGKTLYRVRWKGYSAKDDTWLLASDLSCKDLLKKYRKRIERDNKDVYNVSKINKKYIQLTIRYLRSKKLLIIAVFMEKLTIAFDGKAMPQKTIHGRQKRR
jgi:hypothetical protein